MIRLALARGKSIAEIEAMPAAELAEWLVYHRTVQVLPDPVWAAAMIASTIVNVWTDRTTDPADFIPIVVPDGEAEDSQSATEGMFHFRLIEAGLRSQSNERVRDDPAED